MVDSKLPRRALAFGASFAVVAAWTSFACMPSVEGTPIASSEPAKETKGSGDVPISDAGKTSDGGKIKAKKPPPDGGPKPKPKPKKKGEDAAAPSGPATDCAAQDDFACQDCYFAETSQGNAVKQQIDDAFAECVEAEGCAGNATCEQACNDEAVLETCAEHGAICDLVSACIEANGCFE